MTRVRKPSTPVRRAKVPPPEPKPRACRECKRQKIYCSKDKPKCERCKAKGLLCDYSGAKMIPVNEEKLRYLKAKLKRYEEIFSSLPPEALRSLPGGLTPLKPGDIGDDNEDAADIDNDDDIGANEGDSLSDVPDADADVDADAEDNLPNQFKNMSIYLKASRGSADHFFQVATKLSGLRGRSSGGDDVEGPSGSGSGRASNNGGGDDDDDDHAPALEQTPVFYDEGKLPTRRPTKELSHNIVSVLPTLTDTARNYFNAQHMYIGTIFAFSDPETFERQLEAAYEGPQAFLNAGASDAEVCLIYAKIFMILALGRLYSVNRTTAAASRSQDESPFSNDDKPSAEADDNDRPPGFGYFAHALALLPDVHEPGSILGVETLAYVGYFLQNMNRRDAAYLYIGVALRMAISLGLHQEAPSSLALSEPDREHRRRVWWSIYSLDRILSLKSGHPIAILDEDIGVNMPKQLPGEPVDSPVVMLRCYTELSRILGDITTLIYRRTAPTASSATPLSPTAAKGKGLHTGTSLVTTIHAILQSLTQWEEALPRSLRLDPDRGSKLSRESISMYLHYYQCINMTARPLLFHVVQRRIAAIRKATDAGTEKERDWQTGLAPKTVAVIHACVSAARNTVQIMSKAAGYNMVATYGYMDGEHAFSAAIVLALVYTAFPTNAPTVEAMAKGLALLRRMGDLGNGYVAARYEQLARLRTILGPSTTLTTTQSSSTMNETQQGRGKGKGKAREKVSLQVPLQDPPLPVFPDMAKQPFQNVQYVPGMALFNMPCQQLPQEIAYQDYNYYVSPRGHIGQPGQPTPAYNPPIEQQQQQEPVQPPPDLDFDFDFNDASFFNHMDHCNPSAMDLDALELIFDPPGTSGMFFGDDGGPLQ
ncbi:Transcriptional activator [Sporothrix stenoceras]|uniref:Transcriptional activator n=1 Tax=Sporothrix stenoceras TaxID=5173 RepID=A0ABR3YYK0_9PEZI